MLKNSQDQLFVTGAIIKKEKKPIYIGKSTACKPRCFVPKILMLLDA
jgi:hypothetical protein